jgi:hypothetical protein
MGPTSARAEDQWTVDLNQGQQAVGLNQDQWAVTQQLREQYKNLDQLLYS